MQTIFYQSFEKGISFTSGLKANSVVSLICEHCTIFVFHVHWTTLNHKHTTLVCKDIKIRKSEFVTKTQFLYFDLWHLQGYEKILGS